MSLNNETPDYDDLNDKHLLFAENMKNFSPEKIQKNLTALSTKNITRETSLLLLMLPCWGIYFPPYNIARLSAITRNAGYATTVFDINVESNHYLNTRISEDFWNSSKHWKWEDKYFEEIHHLLLPLFNEYLDKIEKLNPDIVGFSVYFTNREPSHWFAQEIKKRLPSVKIIIGGPICQEKWYSPPKHIDHYFSGEGEQVILDFLDKIESNEIITDRKISSKFNQRLDIDSLPFPDYSDYNFNLYTTPHGVSAEISRGCVAKCSFCTETHFWKYRYRTSKDIVDEIEHQQKIYGSSYFWFIDSLVNGNLKELSHMANKIIDKKIKITWQGYARCDSRMDYNYLLNLKESGCQLLSYGIESGSQKVLDLMQKKITIQEIEQNLIDSKKVGIRSHTNWIIGFPNEDHNAFADTLTTIWRHRNTISAISPGMTCGDATGTDFEWRRERYNMNDYDTPYLNNWYTKDFKNTKVNRVIRLKLFYVFFNECEKYGPIKNGQPRPNIKNDYDLKILSSKEISSLVLNENEIEYEEFDYNIIKDEIYGDYLGNNPLANGVMNEIWVLLRQIWRIHGAYSINLKFDPLYDKKEFGEWLACDYTANHSFSINENGEWKASHFYNYIQTCNNRPFDVINYSFSHNWAGEGKW
jgi:radical SAM superfamily enzyme YgiQ (UPF0313 family)